MQKAMRVDMWKAIGVDMPLDRVLGSWEKLARGVNETLRASPATPAASLQKGRDLEYPSVSNHIQL